MANTQKYLFLDRDGTLINEPADNQIDCLKKLQLEPFVIPALLQLQKAGFLLVMVSNQDGLGSSRYPKSSFDLVQTKLLELFESQGIYFSAIHICPHWSSDGCECRKPRVGLILEYLTNGRMDFENSYVIGDRITDLQLAQNIKTKSILYDRVENNWEFITKQLISCSRTAKISRVTTETQISVSIDLDNSGEINVKTGLGFFDHMLEQLAKHGGFSINLTVLGDLTIDEHHTVEDTALALGSVLRKALGNKLGIHRYGFLLPMDEALAEIAIDLSGRSYFVFNGQFTRDKLGDFPTELVAHFFRSLSESLMAAIHISVKGENVHHMIESIFKGVGRTLREAFKRDNYELPTTKGLL